ncbi:hypothetical protein H2199_003822 [Coniosporium tulheliwenetii]|uniref:Uncharacterized protein n=1 Tax=Coniosporium tulheliwenetii TaxID=3383036 RepID=A0ACC2ZA22_9PEZI|nr:hypothetical protein H2199_003822 [Cladosporium sp. JES 115]
MPQLMGEVPLLTLFADVHYYFSPPTARPLHHRFDKTSYVYLYHHPGQGRGRLEIANNAGTAEQDAFMGYLDTVQVDRSYKHPNLFTITVDGRGVANGHSSPSPQQDMSQWYLPTYDLRSEAKYMYRLHSIDLYFWTTDDADKFLEALKRVVPEDQIRLRDKSSSQYEHRDTMSPVVQKLEQVAISKPYQGRTASVSTTKSYQGPPTAASTSSISATSPPPTEAPPHYAPMAYNPAAPAAPEPIAHREKTPPPPTRKVAPGSLPQLSTITAAPTTALRNSSTLPGLPPPNPAAGAMPGPHTTNPQAPHIPHVQYGQYSSYVQPQQAEAYNIHSQAYRPTKAEATYGHHTEDNHGAQAPGAAPAAGRLEQGLGKVEKGVGRFLKRLDKKL